MVNPHFLMDKNTKLNLFFVGIIFIIGIIIYEEKRKTANIVLKTDIGERYIVKKAAISIRDVTPIFNIKYEGSGALDRSLARVLREQIEKSGISKAEDITSINRYESKAKEKEIYYEKNLKQILDRYADGLIVSYDITYKPIFQDINNYKVVMNAKSIKCFNPLFKDNYKITGYKIIPKLDLLDEKVCNRYANFKIDRYEIKGLLEQVYD